MDVAGSAIGIASLGIQVCRGPLSYCNDWKNYSTDISGTYDAIADLAKTLTVLQPTLESGEVGEEGVERVQSCENGPQTL